MQAIKCVHRRTVHFILSYPERNLQQRHSTLSSCTLMKEASAIHGKGNECFLPDALLLHRWVYRRKRRNISIRRTNKRTRNSCGRRWIMVCPKSSVAFDNGPNRIVILKSSLTNKQKHISRQFHLA